MRAKSYLSSSLLMKCNPKGLNRVFTHSRSSKIFKISLLDSYILQQLGWFLLFSVGLFSALGVTVGTVSDLAYKITEYNLPVMAGILIFLYKIPEYMAYALPISLLLTSLVVYGRLNSDRELTALLSFGVNFYRLVLPALLLSLGITGITFLFNELIVPRSNYQANLLQTPFIAQAELNQQKKDIYYPEYTTIEQESGAKQLKNIYFAEQYNDQTLIGVTIISFDQGKVKQITTAKSARWLNQEQAWSLQSGEINQINSIADGSIKTGKSKTHSFAQIQLPLAVTVFKVAQQKRSPEDMNISQAKDYLALVKDSGTAITIAKLKVRIQQKYAFPFICLIFGLIGSSLGARYDQVNRSHSFGLCVVIVFVYYLLSFVIGSLGISGIISPLAAAWIPNLLGLSAGLWLLQTANG